MMQFTNALKSVGIDVKKKVFKEIYEGCFDFLNQIMDMKPQFLKYSATFRDCNDLIRSRAKAIDIDEANLKSKIGRANPLGE